MKKKRITHWLTEKQTQSVTDFFQRNCVGNFEIASITPDNDTRFPDHLNLTIQETVQGVTDHIDWYFLGMKLEIAIKS